MHIHELKRHDVTINLVIGRTSNISYIQCTCTTVGLSLPKAIQFKDCILRWNLANKRTKSKHWPFHIHNNQQGTDQDNDINHFPSETTSKFWVFLQVEHIVTRKGYSSSFNKLSARATLFAVNALHGAFIFWHQNVKRWNDTAEDTNHFLLKAKINEKG